MYRRYTAKCHFNDLLKSLLMHIHMYVLAFNDTHNHILPGGPSVGIGLTNDDVAMYMEYIKQY